MKKTLKIISAAAGAFTLIAVTLVLIFSALLLDPFTPPPQQELTAADIAMQNRILGQFMRNFTQRNIPEKATMTLTPQEFHSLVKYADMFTASRQLPLRNCSPVLLQGELLLTVPYDTGLHWYFGGWIIGKFRLTISKKGDKLNVQVRDAELGKFKISDKKAQEILDGQLEKLIADPDYEKFNSIVEELSFDEKGNLVIVYRPRNMISLLKR